MQQIAQVLRSNVVEGELLVSFRDIDPEDVILEEPVFIEFDGLPVPFYFESFTRRGTNRALVRLTGIRSLQDAEEVVGRALCVEDDLYEDDETDLTGWTLCDEQGHKVGKVADYEDIPGNTCLWVDTEKGQVLIPLHEDLILSLDEASETLTMRIPDGLLDLQEL